MIFVQSEGTAARRRAWLYLVDATDGITPETGEAAGQPQISKNGAAWANTTATLTAVGNGTYYVELTAGELSDLGKLLIRYKSANTAEFSMVADVVLFNVFGAAPDVNVASIAANAITASAIADNAIDAGAIAADAITAAKIADGAIDAATFAAGAINAAAIAADAIGASELAADAVAEIADQVWDEARSGHVAAGSFGEGVASVQGNVTGQVIGSVGSVLGGVSGSVGSVVGNVGGNVVGSVGSVAANGISAASLAADASTEIRSLASGTADSGTTTTMVDAARTEADTDYWKGCILVITSGNLLGQARNISAFNAATDTITVDRAFTQAIGTHTYEIWPAVDTAALAAAVDAVDNFVDTEITDIQNRLPAALVSGRIDASVGAMAADVVTAAAIATDAIGSAELAATAAQEIADALLDRADAIETGLTLRQAQRLIAAASAGKLSGAATTTVVIRNAVADTKARLTATVDSDGNRSAITADVT